MCTSIYAWDRIYVCVCMYAYCVYMYVCICMYVSNHNSMSVCERCIEALHIGFCVLPVAVTGSPNLLCCILRYFIDFAFCCCAI